jgi:tetratricopeptide (TPR) repeat protein
MSEDDSGALDTTGPDYLLVLAHSRPAEALERARALLAGRPRLAAADASVARQAAGISLRDLGHSEAAVSELRRALRNARASGQPQRVADVRASLGLTLALAGQMAGGMAHLDGAAQVARGVLAGRVLMRRADLLSMLGRHDAALSDLNRAVTILRRHGDALWEARSRTHRGLTLLVMGQTRRADAEFLAAERQYELAGQEWEYATARHNRGLVAAASGRLPEALDYLAEASRRYEKLGTPMPDVAIDRCAVLLSAGLAADAWAEADDAARRLSKAVPGAAKLAELLYSAATAALAAGHPQAARERAGQAALFFRRQCRERWTARTRLVLAQARHADGDSGLSVYRLACSVARQLDAMGAEESLPAHLLAGQIALLRGSRSGAEIHLAAAASARRGGPPLGRSRVCLARALLCQLRGREPAMLAACRRGLDILAEHQRTLGATELRAAVTTHGRELAAIGLRAALRRGDGPRLLVWSERWRATVQAVPPASPPEDAELGRDLTALREVCRQLDSDVLAAPLAAALRRERTRLEAGVRTRVLRTPGAASARVPPLAVPPLLEALGGAVLAELIELDGVLHAVTVRRSGIRLHAVGPAGRAAGEVGYARFLLRRLADERPVPEAAEALDGAGRRLQESLLGPAAAELGSGQVVIVPPGRLNAVPWGLLPALQGQSVSVSPSAAAWLRASTAATPPGRVTLAGGPGLGAAKAELALLARRYPGATVLADGRATAARVLGALDGAWIAHVAAHGTFRADNPLFSSLQLDDGPLTVYDLERLGRAPHRLVLSSCESGRAAPAGTDELLGLASSLMPMGTVGIVAAVVPVHDRITPAIMDSLHEHVALGAGLPDALRLARMAAVATADPATMATACSFLAMGV